MSRATWEGQLEFGLISIPVALYSSERTSELTFHLVDGRDNARIRNVRINQETGNEVPWDQIVRAFEHAEGQYVLLKEEDFARAAVKATRAIHIDTFVDRDDIDPLYFEKPYVLVPRLGAEKTYVLLREALKGTGKIGIARVVIRSRQYLLALMPEGHAIMADRMRFPDELRSPDEFNLPTSWLREYGISAQELDAAEKLVKALASDWKPDRYHDEYREVLLDWIDKKARTGEVVPEPEGLQEPAREEAPDDLLNLLERSLEQVKGD